MRWILLFLLFLPILSSAQELPTRAEVTRYGEHLLELAPRPDGAPQDYTILALTQSAGPGREVRPMTPDLKVVRTLDLPVTLEVGYVQSATVRYTAQDVAYVQITLSTQGVRDATLSGPEGNLLEIRGSVAQNLLWGALWASSSGLISLFWIPNTDARAVYTEAIPVGSDNPRVYSFGGGGNCFAFRGFSSTFTVYPNRLRPGHVYVVEARLECGGGIMGRLSLLGRGIQVEYLHNLPRDASGQPAVNLQTGMPVIAPGREVITPSYPDRLEMGPYYTTDHIPPTTLEAGFQVDRLWRTEKDSVQVFFSPYDGSPIAVCDEYRADRCTRTLFYRRTQADPPGPLTLPPLGPDDFAHPVTAVHYVPVSGPNGARASRLVVHYAPLPPRSYVIQDTFAPW